MNVLMTGASGYIGRSLAPRLANLGVVCTPYDLSNSRDIFNKELLLNDMRGMDGVIHLAGLRGPECLFEGYTEDDFKHINYEGSKLVFNTAHKAGIKRFAFASSVEVYGFPSLQFPDVKQCTFPIGDDSKLPADNNIYAKFKLKTEKYFADKAVEYGITAVAIRFGGIDHPSPWGVSWDNLAKAFKLALTTDKVKGFDYCPICDPEKTGVDLSRARRVLGYE